MPSLPSDWCQQTVIRNNDVQYECIRYAHDDDDHVMVKSTEIESIARHRAKMIQYHDDEQRTWRVAVGILCLILMGCLATYLILVRGTA